jgi:hypothetical protein
VAGNPATTIGGLPTYFAAPGQTVTVQIYLQETLNGNASIINGDGGLYNAAVKVAPVAAQSNYVANATSATTNNTNFSPNAGSANAFGTGANTSAYVYNLTYNSPAFSTGPTSSAGGVNLYLLGTVTLTVGNTPLPTGTATVYNLGEYSKTGQNTNTYGTSNSGAGYDLDNNGTTTGFSPNVSWTGSQAFFGMVSQQFQIIVTPEPSSMFLCGLATVGMGFGAWRRRKAKQQAALVETAA